jgi:hypothetical protein
MQADAGDPTLRANSLMSLGEQIEAVYARDFGGPFPYQDCYLLADLLGISGGDLIPELDYYFGNIAGYGSSASRLQNRSSDELKRARKTLSKDFYQYHPALEPCRHLIDPVRTPLLFRYMHASEEMRLQLLLLLEGVLAAE